jgi:hypothetical protein
VSRKTYLTGALVLVALAATAVGAASSFAKGAAGPPAVDAQIAAAELLAEQRDANIAGPKIVTGVVPGPSDKPTESFRYRVIPPASVVPLIAVTVVNRGSSPVVVALDGFFQAPLAPGAGGSYVDNAEDVMVYCFPGGTECRFEVVVTKVDEAAVPR